MVHTPECIMSLDWFLLYYVNFFHFPVNEADVEHPSIPTPSMLSSYFNDQQYAHDDSSDQLSMTDAFYPSDFPAEGHAKK